MSEFVDRVRALALAWGAPGLFVIALLDSSFLPLPGATDLLLIVMVTRRKEHLVLYVIAAVFGSVAGCLMMHAIGRKGGEAFVRRRFTGARVESALRSLRENGVMAVLIPCLLPPPAPFKIFMLLAGVVGISAARLAVAITIGRGIRYVTLALLAYWFGDRASQYLADHGTTASLVVVGVLVGAAAAYLLWKRARGTGNR
ncbi:MAG TPA: VTT domain-containing protein [Vicinamibacterales bacterium]|jgi:membrane protein YqaA with SNARE-associated domain